ncbi:hypothetical protein KFK09_000745 [Dendrobium nobile]|uniref:Plant heme peroxidase family profile domain-containing protein n=1 Tax=Dendrobium nobile TaxID=94219 RepID=A0A8T3CCQ8_DENNO|nr:hypothetical protein KFK09_000745 [Dendrobium nobile]
MASSLRHSVNIALFLLFSLASAAQLDPNFYSCSCPNLFSTIKPVVQSAISKEKRMGASLLRLFFHDCFVNGCDGSLLLDNTPNFTGEKNAVPNNQSVRGFDVIDKIKAAVEKACPGVVSCADILAITARGSVVIAEGMQGLQTPTSFDNNYYKNLLSLKGLLHSDQQFFNKGSTDSQVRKYANKPNKFNSDFVAAIIKMDDISPLTGSKGEIRKNCRKINKLK